MGHLTEDMTRLRNEISVLKDKRVSFIGDLQSDVVGLRDDAVSMQLRFNNNHNQMAREMKDGLGEFVSNLKTDMSQTIRGFRHDRVDMAHQMKAELKGFVRDIKNYVNELTEEAFNLQEGFQDAHAVMARDLRDNLQKFTANLKADVNCMLADFFSDRAEKTQKIHSDLKVFMNGLEKHVSELAHQTDQMQAAFRDDHTDMAQNLKDKLSNFMSMLKQNVAHMSAGFRQDRIKMTRKSKMDLKNFLSGLQQSLFSLHTDIAELRNANASDIEGARRAWAETSETTRPLAAKPRRTEKQTKGKKPSFSDDLTLIDGIGLSRQKLLNTIGIHTFEQLANRSPAELVVTLGKIGKAAGVEKWIKQAKKMI